MIVVVVLAVIALALHVEILEIGTEEEMILGIVIQEILGIGIKDVMILETEEGMSLETGIEEPILETEETMIVHKNEMYHQEEA
jgi:hypothetical protein